MSPPGDVRTRHVVCVYGCVINHKDRPTCIHDFCLDLCQGDYFFFFLCSCDMARSEACNCVNQSQSSIFLLKKGDVVQNDSSPNHFKIT